MRATRHFRGISSTYEQIMGMSGACYRICFIDVWDYSCTDALAAFDYATPLYRSLGYSFRIVEKLEKQGRKVERLAYPRRNSAKNKSNCWKMRLLWMRKTASLRN